MTPARERRPSQRPSRLSGYSGLLTRHPRLALVAWIALVVVLALAGRNLAGQLEAHPLYIDGTEANTAHEVTLRQFGSDESMVVALRGPGPAVTRQGKVLAARIDALPKTVVVSPWSLGTAISGLRPDPGTAGIVVRVGHREDEALSEMLDLVEGQVERTVREPVQASIAGLPKIFSSYADANETASRTGEMIALPVLLLVLLLVFRSVVAALIPVVVGGLVVASTEGVMRLLLGAVEIDAFALGAAGMLGLALGVDYSLLVVSRFREERAKADQAAAVRATVEASARSIVPAACGLLFAMALAPQVLPGTVVSSSALAIMIATVFSAFSALFAVPAAILLLGGNLERWSLPKRTFVRGGALRVSGRISRRPRVVVGIVLGLMLLGVLGTTLDTGVATPELLPEGSEGRVEEEQVEKALGPGWLAPIEVVVSGRGEPMTSPRRMRSLVAFQELVQQEKGVEEVAGFRTIQRSLKPLSGFESQLAAQQRGARRLGDGLARTQEGVWRSGDSLRAAAAGAGRISEGVADAEDGAGLLTQGLDDAGTGSSRMTAGLSRAKEGTGELAEGTSKTSNGAARLAKELEGGQEGVREMNGNVNSMKSAMEAGNEELAIAKAPLGAAEERLAGAWQAVQQMTVGTTDLQYAAVQRGLREARELLSGKRLEDEQLISPPYEGVAAGISSAQEQFELGLYLAGEIGSNNEEAGEGAEKLAKEARRLDRGIQNLTEGTTKVADGISTLSKEGAALSPALQRLQQGTESLGQGLGRLSGGAGELSSGLGGGVGGAERLASALERMQSGLGSTPGGLRMLRKRAPDLFRSGYFYLAGLDGSTPSQRDLANFMIDLDRGGHTARMMVIPRHPITTSQGEETLALVREDARALSESTGTAVVVGGLSASQLAINDTLRERTELARLALMLVTLIILIPVLRSLLVPLLAAFLNLLTVFATFGVLALLFNDSFLGGPGYIDAANVPATMMVIFALAIDYEVFIFARMREEYVRTGDPTAAVDNGLARTAPVVTGAAVIMITVFLCFSVSEFITLRNFGVGQATAVFIDAFIVRLVVVPAAMKAMGKWSFWMPVWLDRLLPGGGSGPER
jgi:RND superfamily putative drug exporter